MKALRYLLIAMIVVLASVTAQAQFTQDDNTGYQFRSTSTMPSTGSALPQSAVTGTSTAGDMPAAYAPSITSRPRRVNDDDSPGTEPGQQSPVGDGTWALLVLAIGYAIFRVRAVRMRDDA